jgi:hypothetical protein
MNTDLLATAVTTGFEFDWAEEVIKTLGAPILALAIKAANAAKVAGLPGAAVVASLLDTFGPKALQYLLEWVERQQAFVAGTLAIAAPELVIAQMRADFDCMVLELEALQPAGTMALLSVGDGRRFGGLFEKIFKAVIDRLLDKWLGGK